MNFKSKTRHAVPVFTIAKANSNRFNRLRKKNVLEKKRKRQEYCEQIREIYQKKQGLFRVPKNH
jgi:hypothetical protein